MFTCFDDAKDGNLRMRDLCGLSLSERLSFTVTSVGPGLYVSGCCGTVIGLLRLHLSRLT